MGTRALRARSSLRARRARFEFSFGERRRGLRNIGLVNGQLLVSLRAPGARLEFPSGNVRAIRFHSEALTIGP